MRYIKLSVSTRSPLALFDYDKGGKSFWNDLCTLLRKSYPDVVVEKRGAFQYNFFMPFSANDAEVVAKVKEMISSLNIEIDNFIELIAADPSYAKYPGYEEYSGK